MTYKFSEWRIANVSTKHVRETDGERLRDCYGSTTADRYGSVVMVPEAEAEWQEALLVWGQEGMSKEFVAIMRQARVQGLAYVWFDCDGSTVEGAPEFEW